MTTDTEKIELENCPNAGQECVKNTTALSWFLNLMMGRVIAVEKKVSGQPSAWESRIWNLLLCGLVVIMNPKVQGVIGSFVGIKP